VVCAGTAERAAEGPGLCSMRAQAVEQHTPWNAPAATYPGKSPAICHLARNHSRTPSSTDPRLDNRLCQGSFCRTPRPTHPCMHTLPPISRSHALVHTCWGRPVLAVCLPAAGLAHYGGGGHSLPPGGHAGRSPFLLIWLHAVCSASRGQLCGRGGGGGGVGALATLGTVCRRDKLWQPALLLMLLLLLLPLLFLLLRGRERSIPFHRHLLHRRQGRRGHARMLRVTLAHRPAMLLLLLLLLLLCCRCRRRSRQACLQLQPHLLLTLLPALQLCLPMLLCQPLLLRTRLKAVKALGQLRGGVIAQDKARLPCGGAPGVPHVPAKPARAANGICKCVVT